MVTNHTIRGSWMISSSTKPALPRFVKYVAAVVCASSIAFIAGATKQNVAPAAKPAVIAAHVEAAPQAEVSTELLHETTSSVPAAEPMIVSHKKVVSLLVTAYCACPKCCGSNARGLTASGRSISYNGGLFVAADTKLFKFGTQLQIPGYASGQPVEVIDRGGAIKGYHVDVFFSSHEKAKSWGKRNIEVTVLDEIAPMN
jgi:3D (Asp-Asp-Asp) domain-containing protein